MRGGFILVRGLEYGFLTYTARTVYFGEKNTTAGGAGGGNTFFPQLPLDNDLAKLTPNFPQPHYLAVLHIFDTLSQKYVHFFYRFDAFPPFRVRQVAKKQLPLVDLVPDGGGGQAFSFVNGVAVAGGNVFVTYGAGDRESRMLVLTVREMDKMFGEECEGWWGE